MKFICDENLPHNLVAGINLIEKSNHKSPNQGEITHTKELGISNFKDEEIIVLAGKMNAFIITSDKDFKHFKHYKALYKEHNVGVVLYKAINNQDRYWDKVRAIINNWEKIKKMASEAEKPFVLQFDLKGITPLVF